MKAILLSLLLLFASPSWADEITRCIGEYGEELVFKGEFDATLFCTSGVGDVFLDGRFIGNTEYNSCSKRGFFAKVSNDQFDIVITGRPFDMAQPGRAVVETKGKVLFSVESNFYCL